MYLLVLGTVKQGLVHDPVVRAVTLLDTYVADPEERHSAFAAVETIPSIRQKADFCLRWLDSMKAFDRLDTQAQRRQFLLNLICFAACIEGLFFFGAFAYVYFLGSRGLLHGLAGARAGCSATRVPTWPPPSRS
jgi:ribonucleotide reductase beta subunit family protein with ferritin-like domain